MEMTTKPYSKKIGFVTLSRDAKGKWKARFRDPTTGRDVRRVLQTSNESEAIRAGDLTMTLSS